MAPQLLEGGVDAGAAGREGGLANTALRNCYSLPGPAVLLSGLDPLLEPHRLQVLSLAVAVLALHSNPMLAAKLCII